MEILAIVIVIRIVIAAICGAIASHKGRNVVGWVVLGFLFEVIPLIVVACLSNLNEVREKDRYIAEENRRLREQLRQEQIKGESFRQHAAARLDAHDQHLNLDTRSLGPQLGAGIDGSMGQLGAGASAESPWYYAREGRTMGPVQPAEIVSLIQQQVIRTDTLVWSEHMTEWQPIGQVPAFQSQFISQANRVG